MQIKWTFVPVLLATIFFIFSCSKDNDTPATPPPPVVTPPTPVTPTETGTRDPDSLGGGWRRIKVDTTLDFYDIFFVDNKTGYLCGDHYLGKSIDSGLTWQNITPNSLRGNFVNLFFLDANNGWATGSSYMVRTTDGGATWQKVYNNTVFDVQFLDVNVGYITTQDYGIYKTTDGGTTWQLVKSGAADGLFFLDQNTGWYTNIYLNKTTNGGGSFSQSTAQFSVLHQQQVIQFTDALHGWVAGGSVYRTVDGGITFDTITPNMYFSDIRFFDANNGFILSGNKVYSTRDGGKTLTQSCVIQKGTAVELHFTDASHGWVTGTRGYVYRYVKP